MPGRVYETVAADGRGGDARRNAVRARTLLLSGLLLAVTLHAFHAMAVVVIVPVLAADLDGRALYGAVFSAYLLASLVGLIAAGDRVDRRGPRRPLAEGLVVFALGLTGSALAPTMPSLIAARVLEGLGGGAVSAVLTATVNREYAASDRPRILAMMSAAWVLPGLVAPPVAAWIAETYGWRWVFLGVLPLVGVSAGLTLPSLASTAPVAGVRSTARAGLAVQLVAGFGLLLLALERLPALSAVVAFTVGLLVGARALTGIVPVGDRRPAVTTRFLLVFVFFGADTFLPLALTDARHASLFTAGALMTTGALSWSFGAFVQARWATRLAPARVATMGLALVAAGIVGEIVALEPSVPLWVAFVGWSAAGIGMGLVYNATGVVAMAATPSGREGETSTALGVADALGFALAAGAGGAVLAWSERMGGTTALALSIVWSVMVVVCLAACCAGRAMRGGRADAPFEASVVSLPS